LVAEREYEFNGLLMDADSPVKVESIEGLYDADLRDAIVDRMLGHGSYISASFLESKVITITGNINAETAEDFSEAIAALRSSFSPLSVTEPLKFYLPGESERRINCLVSKRSFPVDNEFIHGRLARWAVQLLAGDPRVYSEEEYEVSATGVIENAGDFPTDPLVVFEGASNNTRITNITTLEFVQVNGAIGAGDTVVLDFIEKTVIESGVSRYGDFSQAGNWWSLHPGGNDIGYSGGGTFFIRWRDAWV
jgi:hypothetical protein